MNSSNGPPQIKKQEDSDESPGKPGPKLDAKPPARILNRVPRSSPLLSSLLSCSRSNTSSRCLRAHNLDFPNDLCLTFHLLPQNACRKQKMRCEGAENPPCRRCRHAGLDCLFEKPTREASLTGEAGLECVYFPSHLPASTDSPVLLQADSKPRISRCRHSPDSSCNTELSYGDRLSSQDWPRPNPPLTFSLPAPSIHARPSIAGLSRHCRCFDSHQSVALTPTSAHG
jgi:hypothetical protein